MSEKKFLDYDGLVNVADKVNSRLKTVTEMPSTANNGAVRLYVGETAGVYERGHLYKFLVGTGWVDITALVTTLAAQSVTFDNSGSSLSSDNVQAALTELEQALEQISGGIVPKGTVAFASLPNLSDASVGDMYNISDDFVTTSDFIIPGISEKAGSNVYCANTGTEASPIKKWDVFAASQDIVVDQTYDSTSTNALSGVAVKQAIDESITSVLNTGF